MSLVDLRASEPQIGLGDLIFNRVSKLNFDSTVRPFPCVRHRPSPDTVIASHHRFPRFLMSHLVSRIDPEPCAAKKSNRAFLAEPIVRAHAPLRPVVACPYMPATNRNMHIIASYPFCPLWHPANGNWVGIHSAYRHGQFTAHAKRDASVGQIRQCGQPSPALEPSPGYRWLIRHSA